MLTSFERKVLRRRDLIYIQSPITWRQKLSRSRQKEYGKLDYVDGMNLGQIPKNILTTQYLDKLNTYCLAQLPKYLLCLYVMQQSPRAYLILESCQEETTNQSRIQMTVTGRRKRIFFLIASTYFSSLLLFCSFVLLHPGSAFQSSCSLHFDNILHPSLSISKLSSVIRSDHLLPPICFRSYFLHTNCKCNWISPRFAP